MRARQRERCSMILLLMIGLISGCSAKEEKSAELFGVDGYYSLPDKIIVYRQGDKEEIDQEDQLYHQIIQALNQMFVEAKDIGITQCAIDEYSEKEAKEALALEFIYSDTYKFHYTDWESEISGKYCRLFIPLNRPSHTPVIFFGDEKEYFSGPIGISTEPRELIELINPS